MTRYIRWKEYPIGNINCWFVTALHFDHEKSVHSNSNCTKLEIDIKLGNTKQSRAAFHILMDGV